MVHVSIQLCEASQIVNDGLINFVIKTVKLDKPYHIKKVLMIRTRVIFSPMKGLVACNPNPSCFALIYSYNITRKAFVQASQVKSKPSVGIRSKVVGTKHMTIKMSLTLSITLSNHAPLFDLVSNDVFISGVFDFAHCDAH